MPSPLLTSPSVPPPLDIHLLDEARDWPAALADTDGPQIVISGPGTGKTEFLAQRVAHLIRQGVPARQILVLTFSRRAAAELEHRISQNLDRPVGDATASTFHSFAHRLLESHSHRTASSMPVLMTGPEQVRWVGRLLEEESEDRWPVTFRPILTSATLAEEVADFVMRCHERLLDPDSLARLAARRDDWKALPGFLRRYRQTLQTEGRLDYGLLIAEAVRILETAGDEGVEPIYDYVVVDEFQDTSPAQAHLAMLAAGTQRNITVAADAHQSVYSFRGADLENLAGFARDMATLGEKVRGIRLGRSFRVPAPILAAAERLVAPNRDGPFGGSEVEPAPHEGSVETYTFDQRSAEAEWIASEVERLRLVEGVPLASIAVLVRSTRHLLPELSRALDRRGIPHDRPDARLVDHAAIRLVADVVTVATTPPDSAEVDLAMRRILLGPALALSLGRERELVRSRQRTEAPWPELLRTELPQASGLADLITDSAWATERSAVEGFWHLWDNLTGIERIVADPERREYRVAFSTFARMLERLAERDASVSLADSLDATAAGDFEAAPLLSYTGPVDDRLVVTTLHQAKGLEFEVVFIADAIEGVFPDTRKNPSLLQTQLLSEELTTDPAAQSRFRLEEERRLAYTATTRARRRVVWTATTAGIDEADRRPSRFILAAADVETFDSIGPPPTDAESPPLTPRAFQAQLRRWLLDPHAGPVRRLASLRVLAEHTGWNALTFAGVAAPGPDTGLIGDRVRLSPSQATLYEQCPRRYALERRLRAVNIESSYARFGSLIHEVLEEAEREAMAAGRTRSDLPTALAWLDTVWERYPSFGTPAVDTAWRRRAEKLLAQLYAEWPGGDSEPVSLELSLDMTLEGTEWVGRADRIERTAEGLKIVDYKTTKTAPVLGDVAESLQLGYYILAAAEHPQLASEGPPVAAELWYPLVARKNKAFPFEMENLAAVRERLIAAAEGIRAERWEPRVSRDCQSCAFRSVCPAWPDGREAYR